MDLLIAVGLASFAVFLSCSQTSNLAAQIRSLRDRFDALERRVSDLDDPSGPHRRI